MATSTIKAPVFTLPTTTSCSTLDDIKTYLTARVTSSLGKAVPIRFQPVEIITNFTRWGLYSGILYANEPNYFNVTVSSQFGDAIIIGYAQGTWTVSKVTVSQ